MAIIPVNAGGDLQGALNAAAPGDDLVLEAGATFTGNFTLPVHAGGQNVRVYSSGTIPSAGTRVSPASAAGFATIRAAVGGAPALATVDLAAWYYLFGLQFAPAANGSTNDVITLGNGDRSQQTGVGQLPYNLMIDRCLIAGDPTVGVKRGLALNSGQASILSCYFKDIKKSGQDSNAIAGWNGPGPFLIDNCYLEGAGNCVLFGGSDSASLALMPHDLTLTNSLLSRPFAWRGQGFTVKNLFELKAMIRATITDNVMENNWGGEGQAGPAILFTVRNQDGNAPWSTITDVLFARNTIRSVADVFNVLGVDNLQSSGTLTRLTLRDNIAYDVDGGAYGGTGRFALLNGGDRITVEHNTAPDTTGGVAVYLTDRQITNLVWQNNIGRKGFYFYFGADNGLFGTTALAAWAPGAVATYNAIIGDSSSGNPAGNSYPADVAAVGFTDVPARNYALLASSLYHNAGSDGTDIGARSGGIAGITGSGDVTVGAAALSGSGTVGAPPTPNTGAMIIAAPALAGTGTSTPPEITGTGSLSIGVVSLLAAGQATSVDAVSGSGDITIGAAAFAGSGITTSPLPPPTPPPPPASPSRSTWAKLRRLLKHLLGLG